MKKDNLMKKNTFVNGALFTIIAILVTKLLGLFYVVPFYSLIGVQGGALYGYAYSVYVFFISLSSAGLPLAISRVIAEYNTSGNYDARDRSFFLAKKISFIFSIVSFLLINIFAKTIAYVVLGKVTGGNSISDVAFVIRVVSTAILIVPVLSVYRGYFQGFKYMEAPSFSQILEQLVRVCVILLGSFLSLKIFSSTLANTVGIAVFSATIAALTSYFYLIKKLINNKRKFRKSVPEIKVPVSDRTIVKKIFYYALPLVLIDLSKSIYGIIDVLTVVKALLKIGSYSISEAEGIVSMLSTWGIKFNYVIVAVSAGIVTSMVPSLTELIEKKSAKISDEINRVISLCLFFTVPMTLGIAVLSKPIWFFFYGTSDIGPGLLSYLIFSGFFGSLFVILVTIIQLFNDYKWLIISLIVGVFIKVSFNFPLIASFYREGIPAYYGSITATLFGYIFSIVICFLFLFKKRVYFENLLRNCFDILCGSVLMTIVLIGIKSLVTVEYTNRMISLIIVIVYAIIGMLIYVIYSNKSKVIDRIFGDKYLKRVLLKIRKLIK